MRTPLTSDRASPAGCFPTEGARGTPRGTPRGTGLEDRVPAGQAEALRRLTSPSSGISQ
jgi:hypothetical protein